MFLWLLIESMVYAAQFLEKKIHTFLVTIKPKTNKFEEMILIEILFLF